MAASKGRPVAAGTYQSGLAFAPLYVAAGKGFFREEGLDVEVQVARTDVSLAALANNQDVDYTATLGTVVRGAVSGLPVRAVGIWYEKTAFYLMARPEIQSWTVSNIIRPSRCSTSHSSSQASRMPFWAEGGARSCALPVKRK